MKEVREIEEGRLNETIQKWENICGKKRIH